MTSSRSSFASYKNVNISETNKRYSKKTNPFEISNNYFLFHTHFKHLLFVMLQFSSQDYTNGSKCHRFCMHCVKEINLAILFLFSFSSLIVISTPF